MAMSVASQPNMQHRGSFGVIGAGSMVDLSQVMPPAAPVEQPGQPMQAEVQSPTKPRRKIIKKKKGTLERQGSMSPGATSFDGSFAGSVLENESFASSQGIQAGQSPMQAAQTRVQSVSPIQNTLPTSPQIGEVGNTPTSPIVKKKLKKKKSSASLPPTSPPVQNTASPVSSPNTSLPVAHKIASVFTDAMPTEEAFAQLGVRSIRDHDTTDVTSSVVSTPDTSLTNMACMTQVANAANAANTANTANTGLGRSHSMSVGFTDEPDSATTTPLSPAETKKRKERTTRRKSHGDISGNSSMGRMSMSAAPCNQEPQPSVDLFQEKHTQRGILQGLWCINGKKIEVAGNDVTFMKSGKTYRLKEFPDGSVELQGIRLDKAAKDGSEVIWCDGDVWTRAEVDRVYTPITLDMLGQ